ncbi:zinc finger protein pita-like [Armigeres subalbatus]|uniref:zinc finger protein pita-like n=1 Tax=Armigeres subalbatus TaxID=124917 RepID=UPI002ED38FA7
MSEVCCRCNLPKEPPKSTPSGSASFRYICRLCLMRAEDTEPIFIHPGDSSLADKIFACTGVQVDENAGVGPTSICLHCKTSVYKSYQFLELCQRNNKIIQNLLATQEKPPDQNLASTGSELRMVIRTGVGCQISPVSSKRVNPRRKSTQSRLEESTSASEVSWSDNDDDKDEQSDDDAEVPVRQLAYETDTQEDPPAAKRRMISSPQVNRVPSLVIPRARLNGANQRSSRSSESSLSHASFGSPTLEPLKHDDLFQCEFCDHSFPYQLQFQQHVSLCHADKSNELSCRFCSKTFYTLTDLNKHNNEKHAAAKIIECKLCNRYFTSPVGLHQHYRSIMHRAATGEAVFPRRRNSCVSYGYVSPARRNSISSDYGSGNSYRQNSRNTSADDFNPYDGSYYDEIVTYKCDYCDRTFDDRETLGKHIDVRPCQVVLEPLDLDLLLERMDLDELLMPLNDVPPDDVTIIEPPIEIVDLT